MMKHLLSSLLFAVLTFSLLAFEIRLPQNADAPEKTAGKELQKYLQLLSGEPLRVDLLQDGHSRAKEGDICVGKSVESLNALGLSDWKALRPDEVLYKVDDQGVLWLAGEGTRGTLYAVYEFLEKEYGVRFFTEDCELLPKTTGALSLPAKGTSHRYASPFIARVPYYQDVLEGPAAFSAKCRSNFQSVPGLKGIPAEWGGSDNIIGFVHTFQQLLPERLSQEHPEWFALHDGARHPGATGQPCLTNQEMRRELTRRVLDALRKDAGQSHFISISQNDNLRFCQCDACSAFVEAHGNQTDLLLDCVNQVADAVAKEFPNVYVDTLAYNYTRQPPKTVMPRPNVAIRYCTIEAHSFFPLESAQNDALFQEMLQWRNVAKHMLVWNYVTDFAKYYLPHPNFHTLAQDIRFFQQCNAINVFQQGAHDAAGAAADLADLKIYLLSRLLWNPQEDELQLLDEFLQHFYGPAEPYVRDYLITTTSLVQYNPDARDNCYPADTNSWLPEPQLATLWKRVYDGALALQDDPVYGPRMAVAALPITMTLLEHPELFLKAPAERLPELQDVDPHSLLDFCEKTLKANGIVALSEQKRVTTEKWLLTQLSPFDNTLRLPKATPVNGDLPAELGGMESVYGWEVENLGYKTIDYGPVTLDLVNDPNAHGGKAFTMPNTHHEWFIQLNDLPNGVWDVYLTLRCDPKPGKKPHGPVIWFGNTPAGPDVKDVTAEQIAGSQYQLVHACRSNLGRATYFYIAPLINPSVERVYIDRIFFANPTNEAGAALTR